MIKIIIATGGDKGQEEIIDKLYMKDTTLGENSLVIRILEEIKLELLSINYDSEFEASKEV